jgi:hypothetical protein
MSVSEAASGVIDESVGSKEVVPGADGFHLEPRCRICRNDQVRTKVNDLLATGASYAMVVRALGDDNAKLDKRDQVTIDSVRNHCGRHFPVQQVARATYREILERRANENSVDFIEGASAASVSVGTADARRDPDGPSHRRRACGGRGREPRPVVRQHAHRGRAVEGHRRLRPIRRSHGLPVVKPRRRMSVPGQRIWISRGTRMARRSRAAGSQGWWDRAGTPDRTACRRIPAQ